MPSYIHQGKLLAYSPLNKSRTKQLYSFPKSQRFLDPKVFYSLRLNPQIYEKGSTLSIRNYPVSKVKRPDYLLPSTFTRS